MATRRALVMEGVQDALIDNADILHTGAGIDASAAGAFAIGGTNATTITIGQSGQLVQVAGNLQVDGTSSLVGNSTFTANATFNGNVTFGDAASDTVTFTSEVASDVTFADGAGRTISIGEGSGAGDSLTITAGAGASGDGGAVIIDGATGTGTGGAVTIAPTNAGSVAIGRSGISTTFAGVVDLSSASSVKLISGASFAASAAGEIGIDTTITDYKPSIKFHDGTAERTVLSILTSNIPSTSTHLTYNPTTDELEFSAQTSGATGSDGKVTKSGLTTTAMTAAGLCGYISANNTYTPTDSANADKVIFAGVYDGTSGKMVVAGVVDIEFTTDSDTPTANKLCYLAAAADDTSTGAGKVKCVHTTGISLLTGHIAPIGAVVSGSGGAGAANTVFLRPEKVTAINA